jgi:sugar fermentation stimulation protein A
MKGTYCLLIVLPDERRMAVGALGECMFPAGVYAYVGSALAGIEQRVGRHRGARKRRRWHIDFLLEEGEVIATIAVPSSEKRTECSVARSLQSSGEGRPIVPGFGSSDCKCSSHLLYFGDVPPELAAEQVMMAVAMLQNVYRRTVAD